MLTVHSEIDIVLTDQSMPRMTGLELAAILRKERPTLPVVLVSGHAELPTGTELPLLTKPFRQAQLAEAIAAAIHPDADNVIRLRG
jgi:FixJ family two-component response regulator